MLGIPKRQVTHLTRLVDDLLDVSRITQGRIELQRAPRDDPGRGARFEVRLSLIGRQGAISEAAMTTAVPARKILIVDDNADAADSPAEILRPDGHSAEPVYSASEALARVGSFDPDVVVLDIGLPGMDGFEVARRIRAGGSTARVVALTGYGQSDNIERTRAAGFDAHLVKPVDLDVLMRRLDG